MKKIFLVIILLIPLMLIAIPVGNAGEPPPPGFMISGPNIFGKLTLENQRDDAGDELGYITVTFRGFCKVEYVKKKLCYSVTVFPVFSSNSQTTLNPTSIQSEYHHILFGI